MTLTNARLYGGAMTDARVGSGTMMDARVGSGTISDALTARNWNLIWYDDFDGDTLDATKWTARLGNYSPEYHLPANVTLANSIMTITAKKEDYLMAHYTSGMVHSLTKASWKYGKIDIRMKIPYGQTLCPAVFMVPDIMPWEDWLFDPTRIYGEIDIIEYFHQVVDALADEKHIRGALCYGDPAYAAIARYDTGVNVYEDYHVFGLEWEPHELRWYFDGVLFNTENWWYSSAGNYPRPFDAEFFVIFLFNAFGGGSDDSEYPAEMKVDWIRVYDWNGMDSITPYPYDLAIGYGEIGHGMVG